MRTGRTLAAVLIALLPGALSAQDKEIKALANTIGQSLAKASKKTVAVDFTDLQGNVTELGRYLAEEFEGALAGAGAGIEVVDRTRIKVILQENKLTATGIVDPAAARKVGQFAGVEILITGTITPFGDSVKLSVKALDTATARILTASTTEMAKTKVIAELLGRGVAGPQTARADAPAGGAPASSELPNKITEANGFTFAMGSCRLASASMTCNLTATNGGDDRDLSVWSKAGAGMGQPTRLIDGSGREVIVSRIPIGSNEGMQPTSTMVRGVPVGIQLHFEGVPSGISSNVLLDIHCSESGRSFLLQFRSVPVVSAAPANKK